MKKSTQVAIGGLAASLCILCMFLTGLIPFSTYAMPAIAGMILIAVTIENGFQAAMLVYTAVSILSLFIVPDRQATLLFILFMGYYPIIKSKLDRIKFRVLSYLVKFVIYNIAIVLFYYGTLYIFGIPDLLQDFGDFGQYTVIVALAMANFVFIVYDLALNNMVYSYLHWFRPKILRKIR